MAPTEPERRAETAADEKRRLARQGMDRRGLKHVAIGMALLFGSVGLLIVAEAVGLEQRSTKATVVGLTDLPNFKGVHECVTQLTTGFGYAQLYTYNRCAFAPWRLGDSAEVGVRRLRLTKTIVLSTRGTIFEGASTSLPPS